MADDDPNSALEQPDPYTPPPYDAEAERSRQADLAAQEREAHRLVTPLEKPLDISELRGVHGGLPKDLPKDDVLPLLTVQSGDWYDATAVEHSISVLTDVLGNRGYAFVEVKPQITRNREDRTIDITFSPSEPKKKTNWIQTAPGKAGSPSSASTARPKPISTKVGS